MFNLFRSPSERLAAERAYLRVVEQAHRPGFFAGLGVPDTLDGRFDLICLHAFLYLHRLKRERPRATRLAQSFFDAMFGDFDRDFVAYFDAHQLSIPVGWWVTDEDRERIASAVITFATSRVAAVA